MYTIPLVDLRNSNLIELLKVHNDKAIDIVKSSRRSFGLTSQLLSPIALGLGDILSRKWLEKTNNPYLDEIKQFSEMVSLRGIFSLNLCYEWGCTSSIYKQNNTAILARVLDWPFPRLGENLVVAHQTGKAGDFYNVTWPAVSGMFNGLAPGRFSSAINQAPMRRYKTNFVNDWARNRIRLSKEGLPPSHLLRKVFETASSYSEAKNILATAPLALPAIYILSGVTEQEGCVIERLENQSVIHELEGDKVCAANHFQSHFNGIGSGWFPRATDSSSRIQSANLLAGSDIDDNFNWFHPPIANACSRLALIMNAAAGNLSLIGTEGEKLVTDIFKI